LRAELWSYIKDLTIFFNIDESLSFYNVLKHSQRNDKKFLSELLILNKWFFFFRNRFHDIHKLAILSEELVAIIGCWDQIYKEFGKELREGNLDIKYLDIGLWQQLKEKYNPIITQLASFLKRISKQIDFKFYGFHLLINNPQKDTF